MTLDLDAIEARAKAGESPIEDLIAELRRLRTATLPTRITRPNGTTAEVVSVSVRCAETTGGTWHESMSVGRWRQDSVREELRDSARGGDREG